MYKLQTNLHYFRFKTIANDGPIDVTWYKVKYDDNGDWDGVSFDQNELKIFTDYVINNKTNFSNSNYWTCQEDSDEFPCSTEYDSLPIRGDMPNNLLLRKVPQMSNIGRVVYTSMDIELLNPNSTKNHNYNLDFDVVGIIRQN